MSRRRLYAVLKGAGIRLEQWVIAGRLETACRLLVAPNHAGLPVSAVAARCGFTGPSHFTRRFRAAYGVTPREWRRLRSQASVRTSSGPTVTRARALHADGKGKGELGAGTGPVR
ncbi:helix-turn-helix domain-containing protein [Streptomyces sp. bgisy082]|uniref:helix-turn-helix domain-containing protein n=1 Tax=Streptomyces sp. bgisy082 TaxID=3413776 RepID=UPI003D724732